MSNTASDLKVDRLAQDIRKDVVSNGGLTAPQVEQLGALCTELATDWLREAGSDELAGQVLSELASDISSKLAKQPSEERFAILRAEVMQRRLRRLGVRSLSLGKHVIDQQISDADAKAQGQALMSESDAFADLLRAVPPVQGGDRLLADLQDVRLEALYAIERKAMSLRLSHYASSRGGSKPSPP